MESYEKKADENLIALKRKDENNMTKNVIISILFSVTLLIGIMVCLICNIAISGNLTWSLIPVSSIVFAWVITFPSIILGKRGIMVSLISFSVFIIPYLFLLSSLGQFTRNYTQTVKRAADNKRRYAPGWVHSTCLLRGFPKGAAPHLAHDFAEQSVVCYTLCRRCPENTVAAGEGKGI